MRRTRQVITGEHGAIFIQVGLAIFVLMAFNVFVLDYGMLWIARNQAQNAADAGALAGALARGYDDRDPDLHPVHSLPALIARSVAANNLVWNQAPAPVVSFACPAGVTANCTRVDVHRDGNGGSTELNALFGPVLGVTEQRVRATATAVNGNGNATNCLIPIAFPDDWDERRNPDDQFNRYIETGTPAMPPQLVPGTPDQYAAPAGAYAGRTTISGDYGERIVWTIDHVIGHVPPLAITRGLMVPLDLPGGNTFTQNMQQCSGNTYSIGQPLRIAMGVHPAADVEGGIVARFNRDAAADFDYGNSRITNSCAPGPCGALSPRLLAIPLFDPDRFQRGRATGNWTQAEVGCATNDPCITITNIIGFFIHRIPGAGGGGAFGPHGHFVRYPGVTASAAPSLVDDASWLVTTHLIR
jgi:hypothetical protein